MDTLVRNEILISESKIREIFTPFSPVNQKELLSGRNVEISSILASINTPGQHALIYGARGIGKSSLANIISKIAADSFNYTVYIKKCCSNDSFTSLISEILESHGYDSRCVESTNEHTEGGGANLSVPFVGAKIESHRKKSEKFSFKSQYSSPSWGANVLKDSRTLLVVDEVDVLVSNEDKLKLAEFIKHLSDYESTFKVLIVGISDTGRDLVNNHKSIERCLNEISLQPIGITELRNIIKNGESKTTLRFDDNVIDDISDISGGYPHFVHLIALKCAEEAVLEKRNEISQDNLTSALKLAAQFSEGNLRRSYEDAIKKQTETSQKVLLAAALCHPRGFLISELLEMKNQAVDPDIGDGAVKSCLSRWVKNNELSIITRIERGHYRFNDPRLISYIKMVNGFSYDKDSIIADILKNEYSKRYVRSSR
ncbi:hypothetical protein [Rheinheimera sp.]|uniref:nSTAND1 domain-containing NTPase n=1 Tax=Rheinheimera sp. TaxID=1869214 RepID=UPI0027340363|nr:hypothetical protein [Rheinheimera sp.]MDP2714568.1 hypothetical protein [Rheinheimera sp.]